MLNKFLPAVVRATNTASRIYASNISILRANVCKYVDQRDIVALKASCRKVIRPVREVPLKVESIPRLLPSRTIDLADKTLSFEAPSPSSLLHYGTPSQQSIPSAATE